MWVCLSLVGPDLAVMPKTSPSSLPVTWASRLTYFPPDKMDAILADDIFKRILLNENARIPIEISLICVFKGSIDNKPALVQVMAWHRIATSHYLNQCWPDTLTHICGTSGRWFNYLDPKAWIPDHKDVFKWIQTDDICTDTLIHHRKSTSVAQSNSLKFEVSMSY